jgi:hypothetical protein
MRGVAVDVGVLVEVVLAVAIGAAVVGAVVALLRVMGNWRGDDPKRLAVVPVAGPTGTQRYFARIASSRLLPPMVGRVTLDATHLWFEPGMGPGGPVPVRRITFGSVDASILGATLHVGEGRWWITVSDEPFPSPLFTRRTMPCSVWQRRLTEQFLRQLAERGARSASLSSLPPPPLPPPPPGAG